MYENYFFLLISVKDISDLLWLAIIWCCSSYQNFAEMYLIRFSYWLTGISKAFVHRVLFDFKCKNSYGNGVTEIEKSLDKNVLVLYNRFRKILYLLYNMCMTSWIRRIALNNNIFEFFFICSPKLLKNTCRDINNAIINLEFWQHVI